MKKLKGGRSTDGQLQSGHGDIKYSTGYRVNNAVITMGVRWAPAILGGT